MYSYGVTYQSINLPAGTTAFFITVDMQPLAPTGTKALFEPQINLTSNGAWGGTSVSNSNATAQTLNGVYLLVPASQSWGMSGMPSNLSYTINLQYTGASYGGQTQITGDYTVICWS